MISISFPDGAVRQYEQGVSAMDIAKSISEGLARKVLVASVNNKVVDASLPITEDATVKFLTWDDEAGKNTFWHSSAHLLAEAVESIFPGVKFWVGPALDKGFYYDMDLADKDIRKHWGLPFTVFMKRLFKKVEQVEKIIKNYFLITLSARLVIWC